MKVCRKRVESSALPRSVWQLYRPAAAVLWVTDLCGPSKYRGVCGNLLKWKSVELFSTKTTEHLFLAAPPRSIYKLPHLPSWSITTTWVIIQAMAGTQTIRPPKELWNVGGIYYIKKSHSMFEINIIHICFVVVYCCDMPARIHWMKVHKNKSHDPLKISQLDLIAITCTQTNHSMPWTRWGGTICFFFFF